MNFRTLMAIASLGCCAAAFAQARAEAPSALPLSSIAEKPTPILGNRPDAKVNIDEALGEEFSSLASGIAFKPPAGGKQLPRAIGGDVIVQFVNEKENWQLKVSRLVITKAAPLITDTEIGKNGVLRQGLIETMAEQLKVDTGGAEILRQDPINLNAISIGMIAGRYSVGTETHLTQRAIVQGDDSEQLYFIFDYTTLAPRQGPLENDPQAKKAVDLFSRVVESIKLLDQSQIIRDQTDRLLFTRALYINITEPKMRAALKPERWLRVIREGKDVGYSYVVEEVADGLPRKSKTEAAVVRSTNLSGIRIGVRSRTFPEPGVQVDGESWAWMAMDKKQEEWSNVLFIQNEKTADAKLKKSINTESGVAIWRIKPVKDALAANPGNRGIRQSDDYKLTVTTGSGQPIIKELPPFYMPRTLDHLMPRLLPRGEEKGFMFASYVSDKKEVIRRYVDMGKEGEFILNGQKIHAVPVRDRVGLEGSITTHYISPEGDYLGSINLDSKLTILPCDPDTLQKIWKDANLTRPGDVEVPGVPPSPEIKP